MSIGHIIAFDWGASLYWFGVNPWTRRYKIWRQKLQSSFYSIV